MLAKTYLNYGKKHCSYCYKYLNDEDALRSSGTCSISCEQRQLKCKNLSHCISCQHTKTDILHNNEAYCVQCAATLIVRF